MSRSESGLRDALASMGSGVGYRASSGYGYGTGMGYGSAWGSSLGSGCGPNWGTGSSMIFDKNVPSSTTVETGSRDSDSGQNEDEDRDQGRDQSQDQGQDPNQDANQDAEISSPDDGTERTNRDSDKDEAVSSSSTIDTEVIQDEDAGSCSPTWGTQVYSDEGRMSQSYLDTADYGYYYSGGSSDHYGNYDCGY